MKYLQNSGAVCAAPEFCVFTFIENCSGTKENLNMMLSARIGAARRLLYYSITASPARCF